MVSAIAFFSADIGLKMDPRHSKETIKSQRPWGDIYMVVRNQKCSVDLTSVRPGHRASLHSHEIRYELFHFLDDGAHLELDGQIYHPKAHDEFLIEPGVKHRFWAEQTPFRMLVVCFGKWDAGDQYRHEDDYGRQGKELTP
ncbi:MAG: cupin domain-containing protein [Planctomycetota bacterium]|jgi:mannose-6-phosphate isomerase-like protein (cupin superfamily)